MNSIDSVDVEPMEAIEVIEALRFDECGKDCLHRASDRSGFGRLDLNLLRVFLALASEGRVTGASHKLGVAESTVSHALARLRLTLRDPLFVRSSHGVKPTALANDLTEPFAQALELLQEALSSNKGFDPSTSTRNFNVLMTDAGEMIFVPRLIASIREQRRCQVLIRLLPRQA